MSRTNCTLIITEGVAGSGKSLCRCAYAIPEYLREVDQIRDDAGELVSPGYHISNFPVRVEDWTDTEGKEHQGMASLCAAEYGVSADQVRDRVRIIPEEILEKWRRFESGPWEYFKDMNLSACHIAIDEAHHYCPAIGRGNDAKQHKANWQRWLGEIRHSGATVELLSQDVSKIAPEVVREASLRISLVNGENLRIPRLGILQSDLLELLAKFVTGRYTSFSLEQEAIKIHGKWKVQTGRARRMVPRYFDVYDSFSAPQAGGRAGRGVERAFKRYSHIGILWWFFARNPICCAGGLAGLVFFTWLFLLGGIFQLGQAAGWAAMLPSRVMQAKRDEVKKQTPGVEKPKPVASPAVVARDRIAELPQDVQAQMTKPIRVELEAAYSMIEKIKVDLAAADAAAASAKQEADALAEKLKRAFEVVAITETRVTFREGYDYGVGETIDWGPYEGDRVAEIKWDKRLVVLASGTVLRMGAAEPRSALVRSVGDAIGLQQPSRMQAEAAGLVDTKPGQGGRSELPGSLPSARVNRASAPLVRAAESDAKNERPRNAADSVRTSTVESNGRVDRR